MTATRRWGTLAATAVVPLAVLGVFFVLPVSGMISKGFVQDGQLDIGGVLDVLTRPEIQRAIWFTLWTSTVATLLACAPRAAGGVRPPPRRDPRTDLDPRDPGRAVRAADRRRRASPSSS